MLKKKYTCDLGSGLESSTLKSFGLQTLYNGIDFKAAGTFGSSMMSSTVTGMQL